MKKIYLVVKVDAKGNIINNVVAYDDWNDADAFCACLRSIATRKSIITGKKPVNTYIIQTFTL